jgi:ATP-dependent Clp endopeptidase proteolytic subunit ClpP
MFNNKFNNGGAMKNSQYNLGSVSRPMLDDEEHDGPSPEITDIGNEIFFYSPVINPSVLKLNRKLREMDSNISQLRTSVRGANIPIVLRINSGGGHLFDGFAAMDAIRNCVNPVHTVVDGAAASAATLMSVVGHKRLMNAHSFMLIHQLSGGMWGKFEEMQDSMKNSKLLMDTIASVYTKYTKIPQKILDETLKRDLWLDAKTCKKYGLIDEIIHHS